VRNENEELKNVIEDMTTMIDKLQGEIAIYKERHSYDNTMQKDSYVLDLKNKLAVWERD